MEENILSVTELTQRIKQVFEQDPLLSDCWIRGEISNFTHHSSGHMYFTLKDSGSRIKAIMFAGRNRSLKFIPKEGMKVVARGYISVYERDGAYQMYVEEMQPDGLGSLYLAFQQLKERLEMEGLFTPDAKKLLPVYPKVVGVITSPTGAAVRDIITTIRRRYPVSNVLLHPVVVQGVDAAPAIALAIEKMNELLEVDVLIVGRGGGSLEELWAFNEEVVARAIFASRIPVISAVGHETDFTIADFVADIRAATPTAAAELAVPHITDLAGRIENWEQRMTSTLSSHLRDARRRLERIEQSTVFTRPMNSLQQSRQLVDNFENEMRLHLSKMVSTREKKLADVAQRLAGCSPVERTKRMEQALAHAVQRIVNAAGQIQKSHENQFVRLLDKLDAYSPLQIMRRGYSLTYKESTHQKDGKTAKRSGAQDSSSKAKEHRQLVRSIDQIELGDRVHVRLQDGWLDCQVWGIEEERRHDE